MRKKFGSTYKIYSKCTYLTNKVFCTLSKHYHLTNLKFCLQCLFKNSILSKTATLWRCFWAKSWKKQEKPKAQILRYKAGWDLLLSSALKLISSQFFFSILLCFWTVSSHGTNVEFISHVRLSCYRWSGYRMSLMKNSLVNSFPAQSHVTSNPPCIWISATYKYHHL